MSLQLKMSKRYILRIVFVLLFLHFFSLTATGQNSTSEIDEKKQEVKISPDEFSELDEVPLPENTTDPVILKTLERARQKYLQALLLIERKDTVNAASYFEGAINILNQLVSYPDIEMNSDFTDLAQSIIEDYESNVTNINNLDENSSLFIFRDKLVDELDVISPKPQIKSIDLSDSSSKSDIFDKKKDENSIPLDDNEYVQKSIDFLTKNKIGRKFIKNCFERLGKWGPMLREIIEEEDMPKEIIHLSMVESALNPMAVSRAKAVGMWQFISSTGKAYGLNADDSPWLDERKDPEKATRASMRLLKDLYSDLGDWYLAMAAYNYGPGGVRKSVRRSGKQNPNYWELRDYLPKETRNYVPLFIAVTKVVADPKAYEIDITEFDILEEFAFDTLSINESVSLTALARCASISVDELIEYNPELISSCTPPNVDSYTLRIPEDSRTSFMTILSTLSPKEKQPWVTHTVAKRETFNSIAKKYGVSAEEIASANDMSYTSKRLKRGLKLHIPLDRQEDEADEADEAVTDNEVSKAVTGASSNAFVMHSVKPGETIYSIANHYSVRIADLRNLNNIPYNVETIEPGTDIKIALASTNSPNNGNTKINKPVVVKHQVRSGESLSDIAKIYAVSVDDIKSWNKLDGNPYDGQNLKIISSNINSPKKPKEEVIEDNPTTTSSNNKQSEPKKKRVYHTVRKGENLNSIARKYGVSENDLKRWNPSSIKGNTIYYGTKLRVYSDKKVSSSSKSSTKSKPKYYKVKWGDTLQGISKKFGVSVRTIQKKNKNLTNSSLKAGQSIRIN